MERARKDLFIEGIIYGGRKKVGGRAGAGWRERLCMNL